MMKRRSVIFLGLLFPAFIACNAASFTDSHDPVIQQAANGAAIELTVRISPQLKDKAKPDDWVFIYARALSGPPMPLAAVRKQVRDLPLTITLDDSMAMLPQLRLSSFDQVMVGARVSMTGNARAQPGDLQGQVSPVTPGQPGPVTVIIDSVFPLSAI